MEFEDESKKVEETLKKSIKRKEELQNDKMKWKTDRDKAEEESDDAKQRMEFHEEQYVQANKRQEEHLQKREAFKTIRSKALEDIAEQTKRMETCQKEEDLKQQLSVIACTVLKLVSRVCPST